MTYLYNKSLILSLLSFFLLTVIPSTSYGVKKNKDEGVAEREVCRKLKLRAVSISPEARKNIEKIKGSVQSSHNNEFTKEDSERHIRLSNSLKRKQQMESTTILLNGGKKKLIHFLTLPEKRDFVD